MNSVDSETLYLKLAKIRHRKEDLKLELNELDHQIFFLDYQIAKKHSQFESAQASIDELVTSSKDLEKRLEDLDNELSVQKATKEKLQAGIDAAVLKLEEAKKKDDLDSKFTAIQENFQRIENRLQDNQLV